MHMIMPLDQSSGFLARMLMDAAATLPWAMAESRPPMAMGRQAETTCRPWATDSVAMLPLTFR